MPVEDDVAAARQAVAALQRAVGQLGRHYPQSVDLSRLTADVGRLGEDLDLLCGRERREPEARPPLEVIADSDYTHDFWMDAEDEGLGRSDSTRR